MEWAMNKKGKTRAERKSKKRRSKGKLAMKIKKDTKNLEIKRCGK